MRPALRLAVIFRCETCVRILLRSPMAIDKGVSLREELDRLMLRAIIPDRAKVTAQTPESLRAQWEQFKERWKR